jgi:hypothetical protein
MREGIYELTDEVREGLVENWVAPFYKPVRAGDVGWHSGLGLNGCNGSGEVAVGSIECVIGT